MKPGRNVDDTEDGKGREIAQRINSFLNLLYPFLYALGNITCMWFNCLAHSFSFIEFNSLSQQHSHTHTHTDESVLNQARDFIGDSIFQLQRNSEKEKPTKRPNHIFSWRRSECVARNRMHIHNFASVVGSLHVSAFFFPHSSLIFLRNKCDPFNVWMKTRNGQMPTTHIHIWIYVRDVRPPDGRYLEGLKTKIIRFSNAYTQVVACVAFERCRCRTSVWMMVPKPRRIGLA